nr:MAG TPA: hypothetical protein [Caudoviricetes sp.]
MNLPIRFQLNNRASFSPFSRFAYLSYSIISQFGAKYYFWAWNTILRMM